MGVRDRLEPLFVFDPDTAERAISELAGRDVGPEEARALCDTAIEALAQQHDFGVSATLGMARVAGRVPRRRFFVYRRLVARAARTGPAYAEALARGLAPVMLAGDPRLAGRFLATLRIMHDAGPHTLKKPLDGFVRLLSAGDREAARAYLGLLAAAFAPGLTYHQVLFFIQFLPKLARDLGEDRRAGHLAQVKRVVQAAPRLAESLDQGLDRGLGRLSAAGLADFVDEGLLRHARSREAGARFFALESRAAVDLCRNLMTSVALGEVRPGLSRYLKARVGRPVFLCPCTQAPVAGGWNPPGDFICSDQSGLYLPERIDRCVTSERNRALYQCLARLEAGHIEFGTHDLDSDRAGEMAGRKWDVSRAGELSEMERFLAPFAAPGLALDLFTVFEHARVRMLLLGRYPGMEQNTMALVRREMERMPFDEAGFPELSALYAVLAVGMDDSGELGGRTVRETLGAWRGAGLPTAGVDACAALAERVYPFWAEKARRRFGKEPGDWPRLSTPFDRVFAPRLFYREADDVGRITARIRRKLARAGRKAFASDLRDLIERGELSEDALGRVSEPVDRERREDAPEVDAAAMADFRALLEQARRSGQAPEIDEAPPDSVHWYREWDSEHQDYLPDFCRLVERESRPGDPEFYQRTLEEYGGVVMRVRRSFELLRPESLAILRRWVEGDAFDYRALLDYAVDRRAGRTPGERLYIKRVKQNRDVSVLLLVDLSGSTKHPVPGTETSVLTVEKQAMVLFSEALSVVGDPFAMAGFSGAGRLRVDYVRVKDFDQPMGDEVRQRISGLSPARNTRMGTAVRHATGILAARQSKVRLLIVLGDGFPNDLEYKAEYAVEDTRAAIREARALGVHVHAITVNLSDAAPLDRLYGDVHHNLISDVRELPDKLPRIYRALTA
ncbi:MAG: nitric oxide reductase activation protein NorD [Desulfatibacillaceae bacterium]